MRTQILFQIKLPKDYANGDPPQVRCETDIFHPNIDTKNRLENPATPEQSNVCLSLFQQVIWKQTFGLENIVAGLVYLLYNPNLDSPLCSYFSYDLLDRDEFETKVQMYMRGEEIEGIKFNPDFLNQESHEDKKQDTTETNKINKFGIDEEIAEPADECEGCTMVTVESNKWDETILVPRDAAQWCTEMDNDAGIADMLLKKVDHEQEMFKEGEVSDESIATGHLPPDNNSRFGTSNSREQTTCIQCDREYSGLTGNISRLSRAFLGRMRQLLPSRKRFRLSDLFHRIKR